MWGEARATRLAPDWLCVCVRICECVRGVKSVLRGDGAHWPSPCLIRRTLVCPRLIVSWAPPASAPPLQHRTPQDMLIAAWPLHVTTDRQGLDCGTVERCKDGCTDAMQAGAFPRWCWKWIILYGRALVLYVFKKYILVTLVLHTTYFSLTFLEKTKEREKCVLS